MPETKDKLPAYPFVLLALVFAGFGIYHWADATAHNALPTTQHPNYSIDWCKDQSEDHSQDPSPSFTIVAKEGCFHGWVTISECWDDWGVKQSHNPGDYWQIWPDGSRQPYRLHPYYESVVEDFKYFPGRGTTWKFRYEGKGTYEFYRITKAFGCDKLP